MRKSLGFVLLLFTLAVLPLSSLAAGYPVGKGVRLVLDEPPSPWQVSTQPPGFLVAERAAQLHPQQLEAARRAGIDDPKEAARRMLSINELFLSNAVTGSHLEIDFSPLKPGEAAPSPKMLERSARYAAEDLSGEEGLDQVSANVRAFSLPGALASYRIDAEFVSHDRPTRFIGIVGFAAGHWFYLYYTGPRAATDDVEIVEKILSSCRIEAR